MTQEIVTRQIRLISAAGKIRTAQFEGKDRVVLPVVALVEGVIHAVNSPSPELVLASEFSIAPGGWNGRPIMMNHPEANGQKISANLPSVLEASCFGTIFNAAVSGKKLEMEAWLDPLRAAAIGGDAQTTLDRVLAGQMIEVSVGVFMVFEAKPGTHNGKRYAGVWRQITPDHLAILPEGAIGACSNAMGCGTPRTATKYLVTAAGLHEVTMAQDPVKPRTLRERLVELIPFRANIKGWSDNDVKDVLREALRAVEPAYSYIEAVYESDGFVVYCVATMDPYSEAYFKRDFTIDKGTGAVTLADTRTEVEPVVYFEPTTAEGKKPGCACGTHPTAAQTEEGTMAKTKTERISALMSHAHNPLKDQKMLEAASDDSLTALETQAETAKTAAETATRQAAEAATTAAAATAATEAAARAAAGQPKQKTEAEIEAEFMASAPEPIRTMISRHKAADAAVKSTLVASLKTAQTVYTEAQLNALSVEELQRVAALAKVETPAVDYSARVPRAAAEGGDTDVYSAPPDGYRIALDKLSGAAQKGTVN